MDLLITVIGNAVVHPGFRAELLLDPLQAIEEWRFRLTKGDESLLRDMFTPTKSNKQYMKDLDAALLALETLLYDHISEENVCGKPCRMSVEAPPSVRKLHKAA